MFRFVALMWDSANESQTSTSRRIANRLRSASTQWREVMNSQGLCVLCADVPPEGNGSSEVLVLHQRSGVVLGTLFERSDFSEHDPAPRATLGPQHSARILATHGRDLVDGYWGRYVAFLVDPASGRKWALRDPTGNLRCYFTTIDGISIFFSCMADIARLRLIPFTVNWTFIRTRVAVGSAQAEGNALHEVSELFGGECIELENGGLSRQFYWNPGDIARSDPIENIDSASSQLRRATRACVQAWAACHESIIVRTSGGLDSSIVLGCFRHARSRPRLTSLTYYMADRSRDTLPWARLAVEHTGAEHFEHPRARNVSLRDFLRFVPWPNPVCDISQIETGPVENALARARNATAVFSGDGGDSLFARHSARFAVLEYLRRHGISTRLLSVAADAAMLLNRSIWNVLSEALHAVISGRKLSNYARMLSTRKLVEADVVQSCISNAQYFPHPWFRSPSVSGSIEAQIGTLAQMLSFYDPLRDPQDEYPEKVLPLYSQPIVELCLRIPVYVHIQGAQDRGLARRAFTEDVPSPILRRFWKDRPVGFLEELLAANTELIRETLLDGILVKEKLLNRRKLEQFIGQSAVKSDVVGGEILDHLSTEAWLRHWLGGEYAAAA